MSSFICNKSTSRALNISSNYWNVRTKSTAPFKPSDIASFFFAMQGPINTTFAAGFKLLIILPHAIIGDTEEDILLAISGNLLFIKLTHTGQQQLVIK